MKEAPQKDVRTVPWLLRIAIVTAAGGAGASYYFESVGLMVIGALLGLLLFMIDIILSSQAVATEEKPNSTSMFQPLGEDSGGGVNSNGTPMADHYNDIHGSVWGTGDDR